VIALDLRGMDWNPAPSESEQSAAARGYSPRSAFLGIGQPDMRNTWPRLLIQASCRET
jgi:hypothetical protein